MAGDGRLMKYPYTITSKLVQFPYRFHWKHGRFVRFLALSLALSFPLIATIHRADLYTVISKCKRTVVVDEEIQKSVAFSRKCTPMGRDQKEERTYSLRPCSLNIDGVAFFHSICLNWECMLRLFRDNFSLFELKR